MTNFRFLNDAAMVVAVVAVVCKWFGITCILVQLDSSISTITVYKASDRLC
jgi:hypothetical protein